jgi:hypothetical protein
MNLQRMRIHLQNKETGLYLQDTDNWSRISQEAMDFVSSTAAIDFCMGRKINNVHLVLKFEEQNYQIVIPFLNAPGTPMETALEARAQA